MKKPRFSKAVYWFMIVFLFLPLLVLMVYSFNDGKSLAWRGFSLRWYDKLFNNSPLLWESVGNTLLIAVSSAATATFIGTLAAIGINWYKFPLKRFVQAASFIPLLLPEIILAVAFLSLFKVTGIPLSLLTIFIAHVSFTVPFVILIVMARLSEFDFSIIEASRDLGARERDTLLKVILPISAPGIFSGFIMAFTLSLEDFVVTYYVSQGAPTLPVFIYNSIKRSVPPEVNAFSVILIFSTVLLVLMVSRFLKYVVGSKK